MKHALLAAAMVLFASACSESTAPQTCTAAPPASLFDANLGPDERHQAGATATAPPAGSGWAGLAGSIVNYEYENFAGFRLLFCDGQLNWQGFKGLFDGVTARVEPVFSKVAEGVYFMSWPTPNGGGDNVVVNFSAMRVFGHLGGASDFALISGPILCANTANCLPPLGEPSNPLSTMATLMGNASDAGFSNPGEAMAALRDLTDLAPADAAGQAALTGQTLTFETPEGVVRLTVDGAQTRISVAGGPPVVSPTYATFVEDGIFYISWDGEPNGNHVVFNSHNMRVYDQIAPDGKREEAIYVATCFSGDCC